MNYFITGILILLVFGFLFWENSMNMKKEAEHKKKYNEWLYKTVKDTVKNALKSELSKMKDNTNEK